MDRNARGILQRIVAAKRHEVERLQSVRVALETAAATASPARPFESALRGATVQLIAEFKRRSPSAGWIRQGAAVADVVPGYEAAGAGALSVLTDREFFGGSLADLEEARKLTRLPVLRKDFVIDEVQIVEARAAGSDAVLLIVRILEADQLQHLLAVATKLGLGVLVEAHNALEVGLALTAGARVIGVNNRDLSSFQTDTQTALSLLPRIPGDVIVVAESGIRTRDDVVRYGAEGFDAVLVGESLMRQADPGAGAGALAGCARALRTATGSV